MHRTNARLSTLKGHACTFRVVCAVTPQIFGATNEDTDRLRIMSLTENDDVDLEAAYKLTVSVFAYTGAYTASVLPHARIRRTLPVEARLLST